MASSGRAISASRHRCAPHRCEHSIPTATGYLFRTKGESRAVSSGNGACHGPKQGGAREWLGEISDRVNVARGTPMQWIVVRGDHDRRLVRAELLQQLE